MKKYSFLLKPLFFIFNLLFATWMVIFIEKTNPSDFGRHRSLFEDPPVMNPAKMEKKKHLAKICADYKAGLVDSIGLNTKLDAYLASPDAQSISH